MKRHSAILVALFAINGAMPFVANAVPPAIALTEIVSGLALPVEIATTGEANNRLYVVEQGGRIRIVENGAIRPVDFLNAASLIATNGTERGLLGLAFHPNYATNGAFYIFYTRVADGAITIARYLRSAADPNVADPASAAVILTIPHPVGNHNGGKLAFGPDGYLYIGVGDGGGGGDPDRNGQNTGALLGKLLRIAVDGGTGYTIPPGNPFPGPCATAGCPEIFHYGLRNPWRFSFDKATGDLYIGDVGQGAWEEVDYLPAGAPGGVNFGWGVYEGLACFNDTYFGPAGACAGLTSRTDPVITYPHNGTTGGFSITGGYVYHGTRSAQLRGYYVYGDYVSGRLWAARKLPAGNFEVNVLNLLGANVSTFGVDGLGELYYANRDAGRIFRIDGIGPAVQSRKTHGLGAGAFDIAIDTAQAIGGAVTVEPRNIIGTGHTIVFQFNTGITATGTVSSTAGSASAAISGNDVVVTLTGIPDNSRATVSLTNVNNAGVNADASIGFLVGDVNNSRSVTATDILQVKGRSGQVTDATNFTFDLNASGSITASDILAVKGRSGLVLP